MNHYSHALFKELAAQKLGYVPSPMWGRLIPNDVHPDDRQHMLNIMRTDTPRHVNKNTEAFDDLMSEAKEIKSKLNEKSHIKKKLLTGI